MHLHLLQKWQKGMDAICAIQNMTVTFTDSANVLVMIRLQDRLLDRNLLLQIGSTVFINF